MNRKMRAMLLTIVDLNEIGFKILNMQPIYKTHFLVLTFLETKRFI